MTSTYWPMSHSSSPCSIPTLLAKSCQSFEQFYLSRHSGRRLTWQYSLGNADIRTQFKVRSHDINVSTFALVILLLFEDIGDSDFLSYSVRLSTVPIFQENWHEIRKSKKQPLSLTANSSVTCNPLLVPSSKFWRSTHQVEILTMTTPSPSTSTSLVQCKRSRLLLSLPKLKQRRRGKKLGTA